MTTLTPPDSPPEFWIHLRYQHHERHAFWVWAIPSASIMPSVFPSILRDRLTPSLLATMAADGISEIFEAEHGDPSHRHLHVSRFENGGCPALAGRPAMGWQLLRTHRNRARGWGPAKSVQWIGATLAAHFPGIPPAFGPYPDSIFGSKPEAQAAFHSRLSEQARCAIEAAALADSATPAPARKSKTRSL